MKPIQTTTYYITSRPKNDPEGDWSVLDRNLSAHKATHLYHIYEGEEMSEYDIEIIQEVKIERSVTLDEVRRGW
jgi:hypothetical protein